MANDDPVWDRFDALPEGYFEAHFEGRRYGVVKTVFNEGRSAKLVGRELGGADHVSLNAYRLRNGERLPRPCEMPVEKVERFIRGLILERQGDDGACPGRRSL